MLTFRTKLLLALTGAFGLGIGILSSFSDGFYSAACLLALPILVALAGASIIGDFSQERPMENAAAPAEKKQPDVNWPRAA
jgi:ABC-type phosphate/phosphonate transport system permease subunit